MLQVCVVEVKPEEVEVDFVELSTKGQYLNRSVMWQLQLDLVGSVVYIDKKVDSRGVGANVREIYSKGIPLSNGYVTRSTKIVWRSRSAKYVLLVQLSEEMFSFCPEDGDLYFEKAIKFLSDLFDRWKASSHSLTLVLFSRSYFLGKPEDMRGVHKDSAGNYYRDFYREVVHEESRKEWNEVLVLAKKAFQSFGDLVGWNKADQKTPVYNSSARKGNFLEAINLALNLFSAVPLFLYFIFAAAK